MILSIDLGTTNIKTSILSVELDIVDSQKMRVSRDSTAFQDPQVWIDSLKSCIDSLSNSLNSVDSIVVTSTSGTVVPVDKQGEPTFKAVIYNYICDTYDDFKSACDEFFRPTFSLPKIHWIMVEHPEIYDKTHKFLNPSDFLAHFLTTEIEKTTPTNALKMGYHPTQGWKSDTLSSVGIDPEKLPLDISDDNYIGDLCSEVRNLFDLPRVPVYSGPVDSVANFIATSSSSTGSWTSSLGSSLSVKGITSEFVSHPQFYAYPHPVSGFVFGGHTNLGTQWMINNHSQEFINNMLEKISSIETEYILYPRDGGEVLPLFAPKLGRHMTTDEMSEENKFRAGLKSLLFFEKWMYELISDAGIRVNSVYSTGFLSEFDNISQLRSDILDIDVHIPDVPYLATSRGAAAVALLRQGKIDKLPTVSQSQSFHPSNGSYDIHFDEFKKCLKKKENSSN